MELKEKMKFVRAWGKLCKLQKKLNRLDAECCGVTRGNYTIVLTCNDSGEWVRVYMNEVNGKHSMVALRRDPYEKILSEVEEICKPEGLHFYHQADPRGVSLWVSDKPLNYANYTSEGIPCI